MLLAALQDTGSVALLEQQLRLLSRMVGLAGGRFMARRFRQEAWPLLQRLLRAGPQAGASALAAAAAAATSGGGAGAALLLGVGAGPGSQVGGGGAAGSSSGGGGGGHGVFGSALRRIESAAAASSSWNEATAGGALVLHEPQYRDEGGPLAPATLQRVQVAVLACLQGICGSASAAPAVQGPLAWDVGVLAAPFLADSQALSLREAAARLLVAAASVDADAIWLLLLDLAACSEGAEALLAPSPGQAGACGGRTSTPFGMPTLQQLLPPVAATAGARARGADAADSWQRLLTGSEAASCGKRAAALLSRVAGVSVAWHSKAAQQLQVLQSEGASGAL
jgi:hypothetical protein